MRRLPNATEMGRAFEARDPSYDGIFYVGVRTTGIFCRPSCPARTPKPGNRAYYLTAQDALLAGYRPCKRCRPLHADGTPPAWLGRLLAVVDADPARRLTDDALRELRFEPVRVRRHFVDRFGMTFHAYCRGRRMSKAFQEIRRGRTIDGVALGSGYESHSGFREMFSRTFGFAPGRAATADCILIDWIDSPLGRLLAGANGKGLCFLEFIDRQSLAGQVASLRRHFRTTFVPGENNHLARLGRELSEYFAGSRQQFTVPLLYPGSAFQQAVWNALLRIPYGETRSYEAVAEAIGSRGACRAVGRANGQNRISILVPCHRVVNKDGRLCGYGGGLWRKQRLLDLERG